MVKRTTLEIDQDLLERAKRALGAKTARATIEEALRRVVDGSESALEGRVQEQRDYFKRLGDHVDLAVLNSGDMWR
jgi:Arc/MetJ family transcription regulator